MTTPNLDLKLARQIGHRAELRGQAIAHHIGNLIPDDPAINYNAQTAALLTACAATICTLAKAVESLDELTIGIRDELISLAKEARKTAAPNGS